VGEISTLDPAKINQVLQFQIASNVLSGLHAHQCRVVARGDLAESWTFSDDGTDTIQAAPRASRSTTATG
jgi:hypothetical protein